ncbi:uncharacterized protein N0V89_002450 [Didymosphaeria variabile]|uniref:Uncharacterized protein n=1 Tax=Didymosphaeria variabile TaxID=1932322 RepID=A0A9W8XU66_9PLEO|nr:uncharacterized protein N0V89_002450 [Didymosphaeria variabile]KAJ4357873.1 hypothetical protein N0V89_002450 [Didymosphaeria variabile]
MNSARTVELGRAVIALQSANIELWLTTLITLSPDTIRPPAQQNSVDLQNFEATDLLEHLSLGNVWVRRGNDMHMFLDCTKLGRPLDSHHLQQLGDSIVNAPAWKRFGLCLSLPLNYEPTYGKLRVNIDHYDPIEKPLTNADNSSASAFGTDIRPPEGIPILHLESIEIIMAICETKNRAMARKRPKRKAAKPVSDFGEVEVFFEDANPNAESSCKSDLLRGPGFQSKPADQGDYTRVQARSSETPSNLNFEMKPGSPNRGKRKGHTTSSELAAIEIPDPALSQSERIMVLTDAGLRYSICLHLRGSTANLRVKANTFIYGLSNVAPALWRAGYISALCDPEFQATSAEAAVEILEEYRNLGTRHPDESGERMHGLTRNDLFDLEQSFVQGRTNRTDSNHAVEPNTMNSQCGNSLCSVSTISQPLDDGVAGEEGLYFECDESVKQNLQQADRNSCEVAGAEVTWTSELAIPRTDDENMLFGF